MEAQDQRGDGKAMSATRKRWWGTLEEPEADNDPVTIGHPDANSLFADLQRTKADVFAAQHAATEAAEYLVRAKHNHARAWEDMQQHFINHDLADVPLPKQEGSE